MSMTQVVTEGKTFGFDKPKTRVHLVSFRLDDKHWKTLTNLFESLNIQPRKDTMTNKMLMLIDRVEGLHKTILEHEKEKRMLKGKIKVMEKDKVAMERELRLKPKQFVQPRPSYEEPKPTIAKEGRKKHEHSIGFITNSKAQLPKSEAPGHTKPISKAHVSMNQVQKDDWVVCPDKDDWVRKAVECKKCGDENFKKFSDCFKERVKNPFSDLFKCSKPKPNL